MNVLFLHSNFPAQFRHLAAELVKDENNKVVFGTKRQEGNMEGVQKVIYQPSRQPHPKIHHYVRPLENAVLEGQAVYRLAEKLKEQNFVPDVVYAHSGWGPGLFIKDIFPQATYLCFFEWYYNAHGSDADFDPTDPLSVDDEARIRVKNAPILLDIASCDRGLSPTLWQRQQFPSEFHPKLKVLHDGIDTSFFQPQPGAKLVVSLVDETPTPKKESKGFAPSTSSAKRSLNLSHAEEIVTYVARGMEPYRGFPQFMEAVEIILKRRPKTHVVVVGRDRVAYGKRLPGGKTYKEFMLEKLDLDRTRLHFTGLLPYGEYLKVLQASSVHIYLTRPFVLSWSMLEAMSTGCLVVGSKTAPVEEVIEDGKNGLLADFFSPQDISDRVDEVLDHPDRMESLRIEARKTILERYDLANLLPQHLAWMGYSAARRS